MLQQRGPAGTPRDQFAIAVGDWVELSATLPTTAKDQEQAYPIEADIQGEAVEPLATMCPATLQTRLIGAFNETPLAPFPRPGFGGDRHIIFLRGKKAGKATIRTIVHRSSTWKQTREFEITVTEQREMPQSPPFQ